MNSNSSRRFFVVAILPAACLVLLDGCSSAVTITSINVTPALSSIQVGKTLQFTAMGVYSNGKSADISSQLTWDSDAKSVATITTSGLATGVSAGSAKISATLGKVSGNTTLTVTSAATLVSIAITPNPPPSTVAVGTTLQLTATGTYSDASMKDLTSQVTWDSATNPVATVSASGLLTGVAVGTSNITATLGAVVSPPDLVTVTTTAATLTTITLNPPVATISVGGTFDFTATGHYSDGSTAILAAATWSSGTPGTVAVTGASFSNSAVPPVTTSVGIALGLAASGTAVTIKATSGAIFGTASLTVAAAVARNAYVLGTTDSRGAIYVVNPASTTLIPIASSVGSGVPVQIVLEPSGRYAFSLNSLSIVTAAVDPVSGRLVQPAQLFTPNPPVNSNFGVVDPTGQYLYVVSSGASSTLNAYLINLTDGSLSAIGTPISGFTSLISVIIDRSGKYLYAIDNDPSVQKVFAYSIGVGGALTALAVPSYPTGVLPQYPAIDPTNTYLYIPNQADNSISGYKMNADGSLSPLNGGIAFTTGIGNGPSYVAVEATGKYLYVTNNADSTISAISIGAGGGLGPSTALGSPFSTGAPGTTPFGIAIDPSNTALAVVNLFGNSVSLFNLDASTGVLTPAALPQIESPAGAYFITMSTGAASPSVHPGAVYAANSGSGDITGFTSTAGTGVLTAAVGSPFPGTAGNSIAAADLQGAFLFTRGALVLGDSIIQTSAALSSLTNSPLSVTGPAVGSGLYASPTDSFMVDIETSGSLVQYALDPTTNTLSKTGISSAAFAGAANLAADPQGDFLFALGSSLTNGIQPFITYSNGTGLLAAAQSPALPGNWTSGAVDGGGQYLVAVDSAAKILLSFSIGVPGSGTDGVLTAVGGTQAVTGSGSFVVAFDPLDRVVFVADQAAGTITAYPFTFSTGLLGAAGAVTNVSVNGLTQISIDITGSYLYAGVKAAAVPGSKGAIAVYTIGSGGSLTAVAGSPFSTGTGNPGIAVTNIVQ